MVDYSTETTRNQFDIPIYSEIPLDLASYPQWITYTIDDHGQPLAVSEPLGLRESYEKCLVGDVGLAFLILESDPFVWVHIPNGIKPDGSVSVTAWSTANDLDSYTEVLDDNSLSILVKGKAANQSSREVTIASSGAIVPITGQRYGEARQIRTGTAELPAIIDRYFSPAWVDLLPPDYDKGDLSAQLDICLSQEGWYEAPEKTGLYPFLALCWEYAELRLKIRAAIALDRWTRERREDFIACIEALIPKRETPAKKERVVSAGELSEMLQLDSKDRAKETFYNMSMILQHHEEWAGRLRFDTFRNSITLDGKPMTDTAEERIAEWLGQAYGFGGNHPKSLTRAAHAASTKHPYDSLQEWVEALPEWDGISRLETWMIDMCGAVDDPEGYTRWVSRVTLLQMMARAIHPGCLARLVPIWEGPENRGKSTAIAKLGGQWATTLKISMDSKEAHMSIQGFWVAELEELDTMYKTTEARLKAFITNTEDHFIPKYANHAVTLPRRTVFIGTTNDSRYLKGITGNTRFAPIKVFAFDFALIDELREQLFAEALDVFRTTPDIRWWEEPEHLKEMINRERENRREINIYEEELASWLDGADAGSRYWSEIDWKDIATQFLKIESPERWKDKALQYQITQGLRALGWDRIKKGSKSYWVRGENTVDDIPF